MRKKLVNILTVENGSIGKMSFLWAYSKNEIPPDNVPTVFDTYLSTVKVKDLTVDFKLSDTSSQDDMEDLGAMTYANVDIFLICFSIIDPISFENVEKKWVAEIKRYVKQPFIVLVGLKSDLRNNESTNNDLSQKNALPISYLQGKSKSEKIDAECYCECSSKSLDRVKSVFDQAFEALFKSKKGCNCNIYIKNQLKQVLYFLIFKHK